MGQFLRIAYLVSASSTACLDCNYCKPSSHIFFYQLKTIFAFRFHFCDLISCSVLTGSDAQQENPQDGLREHLKKTLEFCLSRWVYSHNFSGFEASREDLVTNSALYSAHELFLFEWQCRGAAACKNVCFNKLIKEDQGTERTTLTDDSSESPSAYPASQNVVVVNSTLVVLKTKDHTKLETRPKRPMHVYIYMFAS